MGHALNPELIALDDLVAGRLASIIFHLVSQMRCGPGCCKYLAKLVDHLKQPEVPGTPSPQMSHLFPVEDSTFGMSSRKPWKVMQLHHRDQRMPGCIKSKIPVTVKNKANQPLSRVSFGGIFSSNIAGFLLKWVFIAKSLAKKKRNHYSQKLPFVQPSLEAPTTFI